ncbi:oligosaccharyl transferase subunit OST3/OST6 family, partial [Macrolepiota fuliginosa MF-IS2]
MKAFLAVLLAPLALAASSTDQLIKLANQGGGIIKLDPKSFDLITSPKRTWSASIQLTALDKRRKCIPCKEFEPAWAAVAKAWTGVPQAQRDNHFFATLDFDDGPTVFQKLGLSSAPVVLSYTPAKAEPARYDFADGSFEAAPLVEFLSKYTPVPIPYRDPIDWTRWALTSILGLLSLFALRFASPILQSRWTWAVGTILTSLIMISGYMFTRIRGMPYTGHEGNWIAAGFQSQYGQEVHVVAFIYGLLSFAFIMLTVVVPKQSSPHRQRIQVYLWSAVVLIIYSVLVSLFRVKNRGYPFKLFL